MTIVSGLRNKGGESSRSARHHGRHLAVLLSARKDREADSDLGITADQLAARHFGTDTPLPSLEIDR